MSIDEPREPSRRQRSLDDLYLLGASSPIHEDFGVLTVAWLDELRRVVPHTYGRKVAGEFDFPARIEAEDHRKLVHLDNGQVVEVWLNRYQEDPRNDGRWFRRAEVRVYSSRTDKATLAALSVLEGSGVRTDGVERIARGLRGKVALEWTELRHPDNPEITMRVPANPEALPTSEESRLLAFARALLRYHRPNLNQDSEEGIELLVAACRRVYDVAESTRKLSNFLEFGGARRDTRPAREDAELDIYAAELHHIASMTQREVADRLRLSAPTKRDKNKGGHEKAAIRIKRGTNLLKRAIGEDRWPDYVQLLRAEYDTTS